MSALVTTPSTAPVTPSTSAPTGSVPIPLQLPALVGALSTRDLTDPEQGPHALQLLVDDVVGALAARWHAEPRVRRSRPVVSLEDNYDRLGYPATAVARDVRYTRYVSETTMLRSHTSAGIPPALRQLAAEAPPSADVLLALPGMCHRRDSIDRIHTGTPHQLDLWLMRRGGRRLDHDDLQAMVDTLVASLLPGQHWRWSSTEHPYTTGGRQVDVIHEGGAVEIAECGLAAPQVLEDSGLDPRVWSGLALGLGLDRVLMLRKGIDDIRLLRSADPRVSAQLLDLAPYQPMSSLPPARRDLSIAVADTVDDEILGDRVREVLGAHADLVEEVTVLSNTPYDELPPAARERLGIRRGQRGVLMRVVLRPVNRTLTGDEVNDLRDRLYAGLHEGGRG